MSIRAKQKYYNWCVNNGLKVVDFDLERMDFTYPKKNKSSFKKRADFIKNKYNHIFLKKENILEHYPNIESITFEKLNKK